MSIAAHHRRTEKARWTALIVCLCGGVADERNDMEALLNKTAKFTAKAEGGCVVAV
jgi:hypothetical protein